MKKETIATVTIEKMKEYKEDLNTIDLGHYGLLDEIYDVCVKRGIIKDTKHHPLDRQTYIMAQLRKSKKFKKVGNIDYPGYGRAYSNCAVLTPVNN